MAVRAASLPQLIRRHEYERSWVRPDVLAGLTVAAMLVPQAMAYAELGGLPPSAGFRAALVALPIYALIGTSRHLGIGPEPGTAILAAAAAVELAGGDPARYAALMATIAGLVGHLSLVGIFLVWAGRDAFGSFELPDPKYFVIGVAVVAALALIALAVPQTRRLLRDRLVPVLAKAFDGVGSVIRRPGKIVMLIGGSALVTLSYLTTLYFSVEAFGGGLAFATVGAVFLVGSAVAQAAPTPGGLGAVEAALIAGLVAAGLDNTVAVPAVFFYRLFTFWVPILPGWLSFQWLQRNDYL